ncbi:hypothetical protein NBRC116601_28980 [Cognatishimia sp. WU-CL00825]|uniref:hypothetical protein n=1 Tax=Cognatishimia sp. WU-CL00825 TaxID=3127658 RepID=UPI003106CFA8
MSSASKAFKEMNRAERGIFIGTLIWILLQLSRFIAVVLINDINDGLASEAWRYPAYLDLFAAVLAFPLIWAVWARRELLTWAALVIYWTISIVDHIGNFVTTTFVGPPTIAEGMENPYLVPAIQTALDVVFLAVLFIPLGRDLFFQPQN